MTHESKGRRIAPRKKSAPDSVLSAGRALRTVAIVLAALVTPVAHGAGGDPEPEVDRLKAHVVTLASPEFGGRRGEVAEKSRVYLIDEFKKLKLEPLFDGSYYQDVPDREPAPIMGRNVGAKLVGSDPKLRDEWVIVSAHFDHLGVRNGVLYPGADDNATSVAMMLEVARCLVRSTEKPRRSVMLIGFDLEERGLYGSRYFAEHSPVPLDRVALFVTADMLGRSLGGVCPRHVFVMGTERFPESREWVRTASAGKPITVGLLGSDLLLIDRSDYSPFRLRRIPFLFFSTGENPCYHSPSDTADTIDYPKLEANSRMIYAVVRRAIQADRRPGWLAVPDHGMDEARTIHEVFRILLDHRESLKIGKPAAFAMESAVRLLDGVVQRGLITPSERTTMIRLASVVMAVIF
jgi:hypothetical protein